MNMDTFLMWYYQRYVLAYCWNTQVQQSKQNLKLFWSDSDNEGLQFKYVFAEHLSMRQLIMHWILLSVIMYVCMCVTLRNAIYAAGGLHSMCRRQTFCPCSGDGSLHHSILGRSRQLTRLRKFVELGFQLLPLCHIPFFKRWCGAKKRYVAWWVGPQMYNFMLQSVRVQGVSCIFVTLVCTFSITSSYIAFKYRSAIDQKIVVEHINQCGCVLQQLSWECTDVHVIEDKNQFHSAWFKKNTSTYSGCWACSSFCFWRLVSLCFSTLDSGTHSSHLY